MSRPMSDVMDLVENSKLDMSSFTQPIQSIYFANPVFSGDYRVIELDEEMENVLINKQERCVIRGLKDDLAVLSCTTKSWELREAETTNSLLILPSLAVSECEDGQIGDQTVSRQVVALFHNYLEPRHFKLKLNRLRELLLICPYKGPEHENDIDLADMKKFTFHELLNVVPGAEIEFKDAFLQLHVSQIDVVYSGFCRLIDFEYLSRVMSQICDLVTANSWSCFSIPVSEVVDTLEDLEPRFIIEHCLSFFGSISTNDQLCSLDNFKVCRFFAKVILKPVGKFNLNDFTQAWKLTVPEGMEPDISQLKDLAIIDESCNPSSIQYLAEDSLSEDVTERFQQLFAVRTKWTKDDISPFILPLTNEKVNVGNMLMKYCRSTTSDGVRLYTSKNNV